MTAYHTLFHTPQRRMGLHQTLTDQLISINQQIDQSKTRASKDIYEKICKLCNECSTNNIDPLLKVNIYKSALKCIMKLHSYKHPNYLAQFIDYTCILIKTLKQIQSKNKDKPQESEQLRSIQNNLIKWLESQINENTDLTNSILSSSKRFTVKENLSSLQIIFKRIPNICEWRLLKKHLSYKNQENFTPVQSKGIKLYDKLSKFLARKSNNVPINETTSYLNQRPE
jgi:hypothetical protein